MAKKKKQYYRKKQKGVRYVTKALAKYFGKRYPNYSDRQQRARAISDQIKSSGNKVVLKNIFALERKTRIKKVAAGSENLMAGIQPFLTQSQKELFIPQPFWRLAEYDSDIAGLDQQLNITFISTISPAGTKPFKGGDIIGYGEYFQDFVNFTNKRISTLQAKIGRKLSSGEIDYYVMCTAPDENGNSEIISVDEDGNSHDWGFDPLEPKKEPLDTLEVVPKQKPEIPAIEEEEEISEEPEPSLISGSDQIKIKEIELQLEQEKTKQAAIELQTKREERYNKLLQLLLDNKISHEDFDKYMSM